MTQTTIGFLAHSLHCKDKTILAPRLTRAWNTIQGTPEKRSGSAMQGCIARKLIMHVIDLAGGEPDTGRVRRALKILDMFFSASLD